MANNTIPDNIYPEGALVFAKANPSSQLRIMKYYQRIYYCALVGGDTSKPLVYFERELDPPLKRS